MLLYPNGRPVERRPPTLPTRRRLVATVVSCIPDERYPYDPAVVRAIRREFDPDFVPVFVKNVFRHGTGGYVVEGYHAAAAAPDPASVVIGQELQPWVYRTLQRTRGTAFSQRRPTRIHLHFYNRDRSGKPDLREMVPFEWNIYQFLISMRDTMTRQEKREFLEAHDPAVQTGKEVKAADEQAAYEEKQAAGYLARQLQAFDVDDFRRIAARGVDYDPKPATRPSVYLKESPA